MSTETKTMTQKEWFNQIKGKLTDAEEIAFIDAQIAKLDAKAAKAKERANEKRAAGDQLRERIHNLLTNEPKTIPMVLAELDDEDLTEAKVRARLSQLVEFGMAEKTKVKVDSSEKMAYFIPSPELGEAND